MANTSKDPAGSGAARGSDLVAAPEDAIPDRRAPLASSILLEIQVKDRTIIAVRPRPGWAPYFEELLRGVASLERETTLYRAVSAPLLQLPAGRRGLTPLISVDRNPLSILVRRRLGGGVSTPAHTSVRLAYGRPATSLSSSASVKAQQRLCSKGPPHPSGNRELGGGLVVWRLDNRDEIIPPEGQIGGELDSHRAGGFPDLLASPSRILDRLDPRRGTQQPPSRACSANPSPPWCATSPRDSSPTAGTIRHERELNAAGPPQA